MYTYKIRQMQLARAIPIITDSLNLQRRVLAGTKNKTETYPVLIFPCSH